MTRFSANIMKARPSSPAWLLLPLLTALAVPATAAAAPEVSAELPLDEPLPGVAASNRGTLAAARMGDTDMVFWLDSRRGYGQWSPGKGERLYAARVAADGAVLDPVGIDLVPGLLKSLFSNGNAFACAAAQCLAIWQSGQALSAIRLDPEGVGLDPDPLLLAPAGFQSTWPSVAAIGDVYLAVWRQDDASVVMRIVGADGSLSDPVTLAPTTAIPHVAASGGQFLVVWGPEAPDVGQVYGVRVDTTGKVLDAVPIKISSDPLSVGVIAVGGDGSQFFVAWEQGINFDPYKKMMGARVSAQGVVLDPAGLALSSVPSVQRSPSVGFNGTDFVVAWDRYMGLLSSNILAARVTPAGVVLDPEGDTIAGSEDGEVTPVVSCGTGDCLVSYTSFTAIGTPVTIRGMRLDTDLAIKGEPGLLISSAKNAQGVPAATFTGSEHLLVWTDDRTPDGELRSTRLGSDGSMQDPVGLLVAPGPMNHRAAPLLVHGDPGILVAWAGESSRVKWVALDKTGAPLGPPFVLPFDSTERIGGAAGTKSFMLAWGGSMIRAQLVGPAGEPLQALSLGQTDSDPNDMIYSNPQASVAFTGEVYVVVWQYRAQDHLELRYVRVDEDGKLLDNPPRVLHVHPTSGGRPEIACATTSCLVTWSRNDPINLVGQRISLDGEILDIEPIALATNLFDHKVDIAFTGDNYFMSWIVADGNDFQLRGNWFDTDSLQLLPESLVIAPLQQPGPSKISVGAAGEVLVAYNHFDPPPGAGNFRAAARLIGPLAPSGETGTSTDTGSSDTGGTDTGNTDTESTDTESTDTENSNTGNTNTESTDTGNSATGSTVTDAAPTSTTGDPTGPEDTSVPTGPGGASAGTDSAGSSTTAGEDTAESGGCACRVESANTVAPGFLLMLLAGWRRRRRG